MSKPTNTGFVEHDLPYFVFKFSGNNKASNVLLPEKMTCHLRSDKTPTALFRLHGLNEMSWRCRVVDLGDGLHFDHGYEEFCIEVSGFRPTFYLMFMYEGWGMRFTIVRYDTDGNVITCPPFKDAVEYPMYRLEPILDELLYFVWTNPTDPAVLPRGNFVNQLKERGILATYTLKLDTHPNVSWVVEITQDDDMEVVLAYGWKGFAMQTELNANMCIRFTLIDHLIISAIIFSTLRGTVVLLTFGIEETNSHEKGKDAHVAGNCSYAITSPIGESSDCSEEVADDKFFVDISADDYTFANLQSYPNYECIMYENHGVIPQHFAEAHLQKANTWFRIETMENLATLVECVVVGESLFMMEGYKTFKNYFALHNDAKIQIYLVSPFTFVFHRL